MIREKMLKIAVVSHSYPTQQAAAQVPFIKQEAHLIAQEHSVEIHLPAVFALPFQKQYYRTLQPDETELTVHQFSYLSFPGRRLGTITQKSLSKNLLNSIKKQSPNVVHLHWLYPAGLAAPAIKEAGYPLVLTLHGGDWYSNVSNKKLMPLLEKSLLACDKIICVGKQLVEDIGRYNPKFKNKLVHIPHGIDTEIFYPQKDDRSVNKPGWNREKINILCVANLYHGKGIDLLIESFSCLKNRENCHLHIISPAGDVETKIDVDRRITKHSLDRQITFYNSQTQLQLAEFYRSADLLVLPSRKEGFGLVVAEAIACGTPVLATRSGGPEEIVSAECGILVDSESAESLTEGINAILHQLKEYNAAVMHDYIQTRFSNSAKKEHLMSVYQEITD